MNVGLISDTHSPAMGREPPWQVARAFEGVDLILHAGDIYSAECLDWLERIAPVSAVEVAPAPVIGDPRVTDRTVVQADGHAIGLVHDLMIPGMSSEVTPGVIAARAPEGWSLSEALEEFFGAPVDAVVFGHTHVPVVETHQGILLVNPGSPTLPKQIRRLGTVAVMELTPAGAEARIVDLKDFGEQEE